METVFQLPLACIGFLQLVVSILLLLPKSLSLPVARLLKPARNNAASSVVWTVAVAFAGLMVSSLLQLLGNNERAKRADVREVVSTIDYLRAQVSFLLCVFNLLLLFLNRALAGSLIAHAFSLKNLDAMQRQVKGLQAEYERVTAADNASKQKPQAREGGTLRDVLEKQVEDLLADKNILQEKLEAAQKAKVTAEASVTAMQSQMKGFDNHVSKMMEENQLLKRKLAMAGDQTYAKEVQQHMGSARKDD